MKSDNSLMDLVASIGLILAGTIAIILAAAKPQHTALDIMQILFGAVMIGGGAIACDDKIAGRSPKYPLTHAVVGLGFAITAAIVLTRTKDFDVSTAFVVLVGLGGLMFAASGLTQLLARVRNRLNPAADAGTEPTATAPAEPTPAPTAAPVSDPAPETPADANTPVEHPSRHADDQVAPPKN